ncbi:diacylglycerol kinase [Gordonia alkaliphila]|uniref:diacylglycerol/lipid kinase family protein n=1 Tax=Gordonia alkaliphila TaxID=1053547 RepID=UPI001FF4E899|nr:diacylglycerol kinase family protein [Gordonia alkaliphila]MCK0438982.1 diacylglycerol kinase [Gordonia alkaliphila]
MSTGQGRTERGEQPIVAVINPISGGGAAHKQWPAVAAALAERGYTDITEIESQSSAHATEVAAAAAARGAITVAVGGDGHIRDVAEGVLHTPGARLGIAAAGRGNDLARHLRLPEDPVEIAAVIANGVYRMVDVLDVEVPDGSSHVAIGNLYVGLDSVATELINDLRWMGPLAYRVAPVLTALRWKPMKVRLRIDGEVRDELAHFVVVANSGDYGHGLRMVPTASVDSGRLEVLIVHGHVHSLQLAPLMKEAKVGAHVGREYVEIVSASQVELIGDADLPVHTDGDYLSAPPVSVSIRPGVLPILVAR